MFRHSEVIRCICLCVIKHSCTGNCTSRAQVHLPKARLHILFVNKQQRTAKRHIFSFVYWEKVKQRISAEDACVARCHFILYTFGFKKRMLKIG